jgi:hypothetical protein
MTLPDLINGGFELFGGALNWLNVRQILKDKQIKGVSVVPSAIFTTWGFWNLYYYPHLDQWASFTGGLIIVGANAAWVYLALKYKNA